MHWDRNGVLATGRFRTGHGNNFLCGVLYCHARLLLHQYLLRIVFEVEYPPQISLANARFRASSGEAVHLSDSGDSNYILLAQQIPFFDCQWCWACAGSLVSTSQPFVDAVAPPKNNFIDWAGGGGEPLNAEMFDGLEAPPSCEVEDRGPLSWCFVVGATEITLIVA